MGIENALALKQSIEKNFTDTSGNLDATTKGGIFEIFTNNEKAVLSIFDPNGGFDGKNKVHVNFSTAYNKAIKVFNNIFKTLDGIKNNISAFSGASNLADSFGSESNGNLDSFNYMMDNKKFYGIIFDELKDLSAIKATEVSKENVISSFKELDDIANFIPPSAHKGDLSQEVEATDDNSFIYNLTKDLVSGFNKSIGDKINQSQKSQTADAKYSIIFKK